MADNNTILVLQSLCYPQKPSYNRLTITVGYEIMNNWNDIIDIV